MANVMKARATYCVRRREMSFRGDFGSSILKGAAKERSLFEGGLWMIKSEIVFGCVRVYI